MNADIVNPRAFSLKFISLLLILCKIMGRYQKPTTISELSKTKLASKNVESLVEERFCRQAVFTPMAKKKDILILLILAVPFGAR